MSRNIPALLDEHAYTVAVQFKLEGCGKTYTYVTNIPDIKPFDKVIVHVGNDQELKIATVVHVQEEVCIEPNSPIEYKWVISKIDFTKFNETMARNKLIETGIRTAYKRKMRESFKSEVLADLPDDVKALL